MAWNIEIRDTCKWCHAKIDKTPSKRLRSYCSKECRTKVNQINAQEGRSKWQLARYDKAAMTPSPDKKKCGICGKWYRRVGAHVYHRHGMTAREYRKDMKLPVSRGIMTEKGREAARRRALENDMDKQLKKAGKKTRFVLGDPRAKMKKPLNGRKIDLNDYF